MKRITQICSLLLAASTLLPLAAQASEPEKLPVVVGFLSKVNVAQEDDLSKGWGKTTDAAVLGDLRGGADIITTEATLGGTVGNNTATNITTGMNVIDNGSFANSSGLPVVIQNSGANVLIQNATVINLRLQ